MATPLLATQDPVFGDSFLGSKWLDPGYLFSKAYACFYQIYHFIANNLPAIMSLYTTVLFFLSLFFLIVTAYCIVRLVEIRMKEDRHLEHEIEEYAHHLAEKEEKAAQAESVSKNERWVKTLGYLFSQHASDWKLAVIEADSMLDTLMDQLGFKGETLGDKLKSATQEKFRSLTSAWEVHTIRNRIAHDGAGFQLSQHEAKRVIAIYEQIFREFGYI